MDELKKLVFGVCAALLGIQVISALFPEKKSVLVRGLATLSVLTVLLKGILQTDWMIELPDFSTTEFTSQTDTQTIYAKTGTALLQQRLHALLDAAGIQTTNGVQGIEIRYRQDDLGVVEIDGVYVQIRYASDRDRTYAILHSVLTEAVPLTIYVE